MTALFKLRRRRSRSARSQRICRGVVTVETRRIRSQLSNVKVAWNGFKAGMDEVAKTRLDDGLAQIALSEGKASGIAADVPKLDGDVQDMKAVTHRLCTQLETVEAAPEFVGCSAFKEEGVRTDR